MAEAIEAAGDLAAIAGLLVAIGCLYALVFLLRPIVGLLDFGLFGYHPLRPLANALEKYLIGGARAAINASESLLTQLFYGLVDSLGVLIGTPVALGLAIKSALLYLWHVAIRAFVSAIVNPVRTLATKAEADAQTAIRDAARDLTTAEHFASAEATRALDAAKSYAHTADAALHTELTTFVNREVAALRAAESTAIASARAIAVGAEDALHTIEHGMTPAELASLLATIPALAVLVHAIATEAGLDNTDCRTKVKGICGTDPGSWLKLLGELAVMGGVLDFAQIVELGRIVMREGESLVEQVA